MSIVNEAFLSAIKNLNSDGDLRGAFQHLINTGFTDKSSWHPVIDIIDTDEKLYVIIEIPGVDSDDIIIDFYNNKLDISGTKKNIYKDIFLRKEILYGKFSRVINLPICVTNKNNIKTTFTNGVLHIEINKKNEIDKKIRVSIKMESEVNKVD
jgi:HSP20 family protein